MHKLTVYVILQCTQAEGFGFDRDIGAEPRYELAECLEQSKPDPCSRWDIQYEPVHLSIYYLSTFRFIAEYGGGGGGYKKILR
jgi:hypothetical protein